jgi:hypothetical protein
MRADTELALADQTLDANRAARLLARLQAASRQRGFTEWMTRCSASLLALGDIDSSFEDGLPIDDTLHPLVRVLLNASRAL